MEYHAACWLHTCIVSCASARLWVFSDSHVNMELLTGSASGLFLPYRALPSVSKTMDQSQQLKETIDASNEIRNGALPESPGLGVSGANPRLVNGEAGAAVEADLQTISTQSVMKKVLTVSDCEAEMLQSSSRDVEGKDLIVDSSTTMNGLAPETSKTSDNQSQVGNKPQSTQCICG